MTTTADIEQLHAALLAGRWTPTPAERQAGLAIADLAELTVLGIRRAIDPARQSRSRWVVAMESVATVLSLPTIHEEPAERTHLVESAQRLAREIADHSTYPAE